MATTSARSTVDSGGQITFEHIDIPTKRPYNDESTAKVDAALVDAIEAARAAGNDQLAQLLEYELGTYYHDNHC